MKEKEHILKENIDEYFDLGMEAFNKGKYNSATTLFFKALAALADLFILQEEGKVPSSHANRFRILEERYHEIYRLLDRDFPFYQESYTTKMNKEAAELLKDDARELKKKLGI